MNSAEPHHPRKGWRRIILVVVPTLLLYGAILLNVIRASREDQRHPADAIVVLGAAQYNGRPSPVLRARLDHAMELYHQRLAPEILVLGGQAEGDRESEATVGARYLAEHGVTGGRAIAISEGKSTTSSVTALATWADPHQIRTVILVSDPFHSLRLRIESGRVKLVGYTSPTRTSPISQQRTREFRYFLIESVKVPLAWLKQFFL